MFFSKSYREFLKSVTPVLEVPVRANTPPLEAGIFILYLICRAEKFYETMIGEFRRSICGVIGEDKFVIDSEGYRYNVGIILTNFSGQLLWCRRVRNQNAWQFPQGGMLDHEQPQEAMYRELLEELGLMQDDVTLLAETQNWISYLLPEQFIRYDQLPLCIGQKQKWFLLALSSNEEKIRLDHTKYPEFDRWKWVDYWYPVNHVIEFKRTVYQSVLEEFSGYVLKDDT